MNQRMNGFAHIEEQNGCKTAPDRNELNGVNGTDAC